MAATLLMKAPNALRFEIPLHQTNTIGRGPHQDIDLQDPQASRQHAAISWADGSYWVQDRTSTNGTYLNGGRIYGPTRLKDGDVLLMGETTALFSETLKRGAQTFEWDDMSQNEGCEPAERMSCQAYGSVSDRSSC